MNKILQFILFYDFFFKWSSIVAFFTRERGTEKDVIKQRYSNFLGKGTYASIGSYEWA